MSGKKYTIKQAENELQKIIDFLKKYENVWNRMYDLKLHDASWYCWEEDGMKKDFPLCYEKSETSYFSEFCNDTYSLTFRDFLNENDIDFEKTISRIGRTSSFYITNIYDRNIKYVVQNLICEIDAEYYYMGCIDFDIKDNTIVLSPYGEFTKNDDEVQEILEKICNELFDDVKKYFEKPILLVNFINDFKKNQVEYFKDWLEYAEYDLQEEQERERKENIAYNQMLDNIIKQLKIKEEIDFLTRFKINLEQ